MGDVGSVGNYVVAAVFFVIGLYLLGIIKLPWNNAKIKTTKQKGLIAAFILGLLFGIGLGPCTFAYMAPILGVAFQVASSNLPYAIILLLAFGIGHCSIIVLAGTMTKKVQEYLNWTENSKVVSYIKKICGVLVILGGVYMVYITY
jgi:cytochrome c-type biogenesis protein